MYCDLLLDRFGTRILRSDPSHACFSFKFLVSKLIKLLFIDRSKLSNKICKHRV